LNGENLFAFSPDYEPEHVTIDGREARFFYEDFEPQENVSVTIVNPELWQRIEKERAAVAANPGDGEAWGRLGKAYKEAIKMNRGWRWDEGAKRLFRMSVEAYEKCLALKPQDYDWHAGYAELLWWNAQFDGFGSNLEKRDWLVKAADSVRQSLELNPNQALARAILAEMQPLVDLSGPEPVYLILTQTPTPRPTEIEIIIPADTEVQAATPTQEEPTLQPATETPAPTSTPRPTEAPALAEVSTEAPAAEDQPAAGQSPARRTCPSAALPALFAAAWGARRTFKRPFSPTSFP